MYNLNHGETSDRKFYLTKLTKNHDLYSSNKSIRKDKRLRKSSRLNETKINVICDYILDFVLKKKVLLKDGLKVYRKELAHVVREAGKSKICEEGPQAGDP